MKLLFICSRNRLRSPTAEAVFSAVEGLEALSAGVSPDADEPLTPDAIEWADLIFVMEPQHRTKMLRSFAPLLRDKRIVCLGIPDEYEFMQAELIHRLWDRVRITIPELPESPPV